MRARHSRWPGEIPAEIARDARPAAGASRPRHRRAPAASPCSASCPSRMIWPLAGGEGEAAEMGLAAHGIAAVDPVADTAEQVLQRPAARWRRRCWSAGPSGTRSGRNRRGRCRWAGRRRAPPSRGYAAARPARRAAPAGCSGSGRPRRRRRATRGGPRRCRRRPRSAGPTRRVARAASARRRRGDRARVSASLRCPSVWCTRAPRQPGIEHDRIGAGADPRGAEQRHARAGPPVRKR